MKVESGYSYSRDVVLYFSFGRVAQLGERIHGMDEVAGSTPVTSTKFPPQLLPFVVLFSNPLHFLRGLLMNIIRSLGGRRLRPQ